MSPENVMQSMIEEALLNEKLITQDQLSIAKESQKNLGDPLEQILVERGFVTEEALLKAVAKQAQTSFVSLARYKIDPDAVKLLPLAMARKYRAIPLFQVENKIVIATSNPMNVSGIDAIRETTQLDVEAYFALDSDIEMAINEFYRGVDLTSQTSGVKVEIVGDEDRYFTNVSTEKIEKEASGESVVATVNNIIHQSLQDRASDIHMEPSRNDLRIRFRVDGVLDDFTALQKNMHLPVVSRIKIMGGMDVAERRIPQDGRVRVRVGNKETDLRIATYPTMFGEAAAIRLLTKSQLMTLEELGFSVSDLDTFKQLISKPHGIFLVTGPTGSGKSTTLYASLLKICSKDKHILSVEDPIEHEIPGVDQQQVNIKAGLTFASSLRSMLREDPDVIMVGEIRDAETADIAIRAAMTGHLVFSTLHTNTAAGAMPRLIDLGVEPYLISSTIIGVMAQRLVRRICPKCKVETELTELQIRKLGFKKNEAKAYKGRGCKNCRNTGFYGRVGLFEILTITQGIQELIEQRAPEFKIREQAEKDNLRTMLVDGAEKVKAGITTAEEALKVIVGGF